VARQLTRAPRYARGFTLLELVIAAIVIAILAAIALPSYTEQVMKTRRAEGQAMLTDMAARLERCYTRFSAYDNAACAGVVAGSSEGGWYAVSNTSSVTAQAYTLVVAPQKAQATKDTKCANLTLTHTGVKGQSGTPPSGYKCW
jgi:type IV pilus assembly protein PilE